MKTALGKTCPACGERYEPGVLFCPIDGTPLASSARTVSDPSIDSDPYLGLELEGQIKLASLVGIGSMGRVYRAFQSGVDRDVAVKVLHRELARNHELVTRFHREAKIASRLVHPNVVQVLMTGTVPERPERRIGGEIYLVMEYLDGISLLSALAAAGAEDGDALPLPRALHIVLQLCDAVGEAHAQGVVHRDLKPENIMLVRRGEDQDFVKVLDFGIARLDWAEHGATQAGLIFGTAKYISPEGAEGQRVGPQADVYAIATIFYQCLAGRTPFEGDQPMALLMAQIQSPAPDLRSVDRASYVPDPIADLIMQNLSKDPADRADDARALRRDLLNAARSAGVTLESMMGVASLKLESRQRTRQHELSDEIARVIGNFSKTRVTEARRSEPSVAARPTPSGSSEPPSGPPSPRGSTPGARISATGTRSSTPSPRSSSPGTRSSTPAPRSSNPRHSGAVFSAAQSTVLADDEDRPADDTIPGTVQVPAGEARPGFTMPGFPLDDGSSRTSEPTMQGHIVSLARSFESSPGLDEADNGTFEPHAAPSSSGKALRARARSRSTRIAVLVGALVFVPLAAFAAVHFMRSSSATQANEAERELDAARDALSRRAWDAPPGQNVKEITDRAMTKFPNDRRFVSLREEAAERIVSDALGRKYAGSADDALRLAKLAAILHPGLAPAEQLAHELEQGRAPAIEPGPVPGEPSATRPATSASRPGRPDGKPSPSGTGKAAASSSAGAPGPALPPQPPPLPDDPPLPTSTSRPWL